MCFQQQFIFELKGSEKARNQKKIKRESSFETQEGDTEDISTNLVIRKTRWGYRRHIYYCSAGCAVEDLSLIHI